MGSKGFKSAKKGKSQNTMRTVTPEMFRDREASNRMSTPVQDAPKGPRKPTKQKVKKEQAITRLYGKNKSKKQYSEKDLNIPTLNRAIAPGVKIKSGKKGKKFVDDHDQITLQRLVKTIGSELDKVTESKLEKAKRLEEIRALKLKEIEKKEQAKKEQIEDKKSELKRKASVARTMRRKNRKELLTPSATSTSSEPSRKSTKKVSFA